MEAPKIRFELEDRDMAVKELLEFMVEFGRLLDAHIADARAVMVRTVDQAMASVSQLSEAADKNLKMADEVIVKANDKFVRKSAKDLDASYADPTSKVKAINEQISAHMAGLSNLDNSVKDVMFSIMGALSMDDVVRQRLEHVTNAIHAMEEGVARVVGDFTAGNLSIEKVTVTSNTMADRMYTAFTMEDEKTVFKNILGDIKAYR